MKEEFSAPGDDRRTSAILEDVWENGEKLVRQELDLALAELDRKVEAAKVDLVTTSMGAAVLYAGILALIASAALVLSRWLDPWLATLIVGLVVAGSGYAMLHRGAKELGGEMSPPKLTQRSVKRTAKSLKEAVK